MDPRSGGMAAIGNRPPHMPPFAIVYVIEKEKKVLHVERSKSRPRIQLWPCGCVAFESNTCAKPSFVPIGLRVHVYLLPNTMYLIRHLHLVRGQFFRELLLRLLPRLTTN